MSYLYEWHDQPAPAVDEAFPALVLGDLPARIRSAFEGVRAEFSPAGRAAEANQDSDGETTACPCDQFCPDGERCDGLTTQEAVAQLNAEQRADEADDLDRPVTKPAAENRCAHCGDAIYLIDGAWKHRPGLRSPHDPEPANLASH